MQRSAEGLAGRAPLVDSGGVYLAGGYAFKAESLNASSVSFAADRFRFIYDRYLAGKNMHIYLSVIPDKNYFAAPGSDQPSIDYEKLIADLKAQTDFAAYIDITQTLELSDYYRTDSHWRQDRILDTAALLASAMNTPLAASYETVTADVPFYGSYSGKTLIPLPPDEICYLENDALKNCHVYDYETDSRLPVYDLDRLSGDNPYEMFLSGPKALLAIQNPAAASDKELILFRDSFASSLAPLLAEGYRTVTLVDIRYLSPAILDRFLTFDGQDVLFLYSTPVLNNSITLK